MTDIRVKDLTEATVPGADYYLLTDSLTDGVKKVKTTNVVKPADIGAASLAGTETLTNKTISGASNTLTNVPNSALTNSGVTVSGHPLALGGALNLTPADLGTIADSTILANTTGALGSASATAIAAVMDKQLGATQGSVAYRSATGWTSLAPGVLGQYLKTQGPGANPIYDTPAGGGDMLAAIYAKRIYGQDTVAAATAATIPAAQQAIITGGYAAVGDGGGAEYKRVGSAPTHAGKFQSADGAWWEIAERVLSPFMFGAKGDGTTDDTTALLNWASCPVSSVKRGAGGTFVGSATVNFNAGDDVEGGIYDFSAATSMAAGAACLSMADTLTSISFTNATYTRGQCDGLAIGSVTSINVGDMLVLYDSGNNTFSNWRLEYRRGEFCRVGAKNAGANTVDVMLPLYDNYVLGTGVYKLGGKSGRFANMEISQPYIQNVGLRISYLDRPVIDNVRTHGSTYTGIEIKVCADFTFRGVPFQASPIVDDEYGIIISNSQGGTMTGLGASGRHPFAFGGGDYPCCVPCRGISVYGATLSNVSPVSAGDLHGNTEDIKFFGVTFASGSDIGGKNHKFIGCRFLGRRDSGIALYLGEPVSGDFHFDACSIESIIDPNALSYSVIELSNWASASGNCRFRFTNCDIKAPAATSFLFRENLVSGSFSGAIEISDCTIDAPGCTTLIDIRRTSGATSIDHITINDISGLPNGAQYVGNFSIGTLGVAKYMLPSQSGTVSIPFNTVAANYTSVVTFNHPYPVVPSVTICGSDYAIGSSPVAFAATPAAANFTARVFTTLGGNFSVAGSAAGQWTASLN